MLHFGVYFIGELNNLLTKGGTPKKNKMTKALSILLVLCLLSTTAFAVGSETVTPRYTYVAHIAVGFGIEYENNGRSYCHTGITLYNSTHSCSLTMVLQRNDGSGWDDVKTWSGSGGQDLDLSEYWYVVPGYEYRTANTIRVYNASGRLIETITTYSEIWEY